MNIYYLSGACDFESQSFCTWTQVPNAVNRTGYDNFDWELGSGSTPSAGTGPVVDHTKGTALGRYVLYVLYVKFVVVYLKLL